MGEKIEEATGGRVKFVYYPGQSLVEYREAFEALQAGLVQMAEVWPHNTPGLLPASEIFSLPLLGGHSAAVYCTAARDFVDNAPEAQPIRDEFSPVHRLSIHSSAPDNLHTRTKLITCLEDMKGEIIGGENPMQLAALEQWGAIPMRAEVPDAPLMLEKGLIEGGFWPYAPLRSGGLSEHLHYHTNIDLNFCVSFPCMNKEFWESLPEDIKAAFNEYMSGETYALLIGTTLDNGSVTDQASFKEKGDEFYTLPPEELARWLPGAMPSYEVWYEDVADKLTRQEAEAMVDKLREYVDKYTKNPLEEPEWFGYAGRPGSPRRPTK